MKSARPLQGLLIVWSVWELINAVLSTFAAPQGASLVGWAPKGGWTSDLFLMSQQYGMVLFLLAGVYLLIAADPQRYRAFVWIPIAEQGIGIAYGVFGLIGSHAITGAQFTTQVVINVVLAALFYLLRPSSGASSSAVRTVSA
jgi:hypothetical protein